MSPRPSTSGLAHPLPALSPGLGRWAHSLELLHLPLYTISQAALSLRVALFLVSCIFTDIAFALSALLVALLVVNDEFWPKRSYGIVASLVISFGILGTICRRVAQRRRVWDMGLL